MARVRLGAAVARHKRVCLHLHFRFYTHLIARCVTLPILAHRPTGALRGPWRVWVALQSAWLSNLHLHLHPRLDLHLHLHPCLRLQLHLHLHLYLHLRLHLRMQLHPHLRLYLHLHMRLQKPHLHLHLYLRF